MTTITCIEFNGETHVLEVEAGQSLMQSAVANAVFGIIGECGGSCMCGTCHVYVDPAWVDRVGEKSESEALLLEEVCDPRPNSRLSCQIRMSPALDGLVVRLPAKQV